MLKKEQCLERTKDLLSLVPLGSKLDGGSYLINYIV